MKSPLALVLGLASLIAPGVAAGSDAPQNATAKLAQAGEVSCRPALPVFCSNIHVACSGPSSMKAFPFKLRASSTGASIESTSDTEGVRELYKGARVEWESDGAYVILRPRQASGYIKLVADGTYIIRHYAAQYSATMSRGHCD